MGEFDVSVQSPLYACLVRLATALLSQVFGIRLFGPAASDITDGDVDREIAGTAVLQLNTNEISRLRSTNNMEEEPWKFTTSFTSMANG